jgi:hypothetical protein
MLSSRGSRARSERKVRVEFHPSGRLKKIEAQTPEEVMSLIEAVKSAIRPGSKSQEK